MKTTGMSLPVPVTALTTACIMLLAFFPTAAQADATDAARIAGDLKVDGIHFTSDNSVQTKANPWGNGDPAAPGSIGFMQGNVGIGTLTPSANFEVVGTIKATRQLGIGGDVKADGNLTLVESTTTAGNIMKGGAPFIHNIGPGNTFIGEYAGNLSMTGSDNTASGTQSMFSITTGFFNTASGYQTLFMNTSGYENTAIGFQALYANTTGYDNSASGTSSLSANTTGVGNTASGAFSLLANKTGNANSAYGHSALFFNTTGYNNTASGSHSLYNNSTGYYNTAIGDNSLSSNTTGNNNTASGVQALYSNSTGIYNTATGAYALNNNSTGNNNVALGFQSGYNTDGSNNILIGNTGVVGESGTIRIGTGGTHTATYLAGDVSIEPSRTLNFGAAIRQMINLWGTSYGIGVQDYTFYSRSGSNFAWYKGGGHSNTPFDPGTDGKSIGTMLMKLDASGNLTVPGNVTAANVTSPSDLRLKTDIIPLDDALDKLLRLRGVSYVMKADETRERKIGVIAQELEQEYPELVATDNDGMKSVAYANLTAVLIEAIKDLKNENSALRVRIEQLENARTGH